MNRTRREGITGQEKNMISQGQRVKKILFYATFFLIYNCISDLCLWVSKP